MGVELVLAAASVGTFPLFHPAAGIATQSHSSGSLGALTCGASLLGRGAYDETRAGKARDSRHDDAKAEFDEPFGQGQSTKASGISDTKASALQARQRLIDVELQ